MAGTVTFSQRSAGQRVRRYTWVWTSDASGAVGGHSVALDPGSVLAVTFLPGSGGSQPTAAYDVTLVCDAHAVDVFNDEGLNLSNTAGSHHSVFSYNADKSAFFRQFCHGGGYSLAVAGAGDAKSGTVELFMSSQPL